MNSITIDSDSIALLAVGDDVDGWERVEQTNWTEDELDCYTSLLFARNLDSGKVYSFTLFRYGDEITLPQKGDEVRKMAITTMGWVPVND